MPHVVPENQIPMPNALTFTPEVKTAKLVKWLRITPDTQWTATRLNQAADAIEAQSAALCDLLTLHEADAWNEDHGPVLWHFLDEYGGLCEAPIVSCGGDELDGRQPWDGYYTHWSKLPPMPQYPLRSLMIAPPGTLICDEVWDVVEA